ncbi:MAG: PKD domain-containing protein [Cyclobacteriaceae bacterium]
MDKKVFLLIIALVAVVSILYGGPGDGFIENKSQWPSNVDFMAPVPGGHMAISAGQFTYYFLDHKRMEELHEATHGSRSESDLSFSAEVINGRKIGVSFLGSNKSSKPSPQLKSKRFYNYFLGNDKSRWASKVHSYDKIIYEDFYEGIDLVLTSVGNNVKYDLVIDAVADPGQIMLQYEGMGSLRLDGGDLVVDGLIAQIREKKPIAFQWIDGKKRMVACEYQLVGNNLSFNFPSGYDPCYEIVLDPLLIFSTYSGSTADNWGSTATPGENGTLYSAGVTNQITFGGAFPATPGAFQTSYGGLYDVAILKYDSAGQNLLYATYLGGSSSESPHSLVVNANEELVVLGTTSSSNFPTTVGAYDTNFGGGVAEQNVITYDNGSDIFVAKISKDGSVLLGSTYLGGTANDGLNQTGTALVVNYGDQLRGDIITDSNNDIYISTVTQSSDFPAINSFNTTYQGGVSDAVVAKLSNDLTQLIWSAFIGGGSSDASHTIKFDSQGKLFVGGGSASVDFPTTVGSYQQARAGGVDGWVAKLESDGSNLLAATYTGTTQFDQVYFLDLNQSDEVYIYGQTAGSFPITPGVYNNPNSGQFLQKLDNDLSAVLVSTVFGSGAGIPNISPTAFLVNDCNNIYMTGWGGVLNQLGGFWFSSTLGMPTTPDAFQLTSSGSDFYFIVLTEDATQFLYGTYMGGGLSRTHVDGGTSRFDKGGIVYHAVCSGCAAQNGSGQSSSDFPTTPGAWSNTNNSPNCNNAAFKFDLSSLQARLVTNSLALDMPGLTQVCLSDTIVFQNRSIGGQFFEWDFGDGTTASQLDTLAILHEYKQVGQYQVKLRAVDVGTCVGEDFDFATITVNEATGFVGNDKLICGGSEVALQAGGGVFYQWETLDGALVAAEPTPVFTPEDSTTYIATVIDANGCKVKDSVRVDVVPSIDIQFEYVRETDCVARPALQITNLTDENEDVFIDFGDGNTSQERRLRYSYANDGNYRIRIVGRKEFCTYEQVVELPFFTIRIPNVLTPLESPGSAGKNDTFKILYGESEDAPTTGEAGVPVSLTVYNRWGNLVFNDLDYQDNWDAKGLEPGVYYYDIRIENDTNCKGWVQVIN